jgi:hypothetical protein
VYYDRILPKNTSNFPLATNTTAVGNWNALETGTEIYHKKSKKILTCFFILRASQNLKQTPTKMITLSRTNIWYKFNVFFKRDFWLPLCILFMKWTPLPSLLPPILCALRIEMENYFQPMTMGKVLALSPLVLIGSIQIRCRILDINTVNPGKLVGFNLVGWGIFYRGANT